MSRLQPVVNEIARARGIWLVLNADASPILWADPTLDITADIVERLGAR